MPFDTLPELSPEQNFARKLAARELARYCQEFARWRQTKRASAAVDNSLAACRTPAVASTKEPKLPSSLSSA